jgi:hypothetical protein
MGVDMIMVVPLPLRVALVARMSRHGAVIVPIMAGRAPPGYWRAEFLVAMPRVIVIVSMARTRSFSGLKCWHARFLA